jgi:hypothetical protein
VTPEHLSRCTRNSSRLNGRMRDYARPPFRTKDRASNGFKKPMAAHQYLGTNAQLMQGAFMVETGNFLIHKHASGYSSPIC